VLVLPLRHLLLRHISSALLLAAPPPGSDVVKARWRLEAISAERCRWRLDGGWKTMRG